MKDTFNHFMAIFKAIGNFAVFALIALVSYNPDNMLFQLFGATMIIIGLLISRYIYKLILKKGIAEVASATFSTPDLDELYQFAHKKASKML
jgi:hypothetical protein